GSLEKCSTTDDQAKKEWKKRYFVFKHFPTSSTKCLEYYKDKNWRKQDPKGVLTLHPGYEVVKIFDSKRKFVFEVKTVEHVFRLAAHTEDELNKWILILEKENIVKSFVVEPVLDEAMTKLGAQNTCHLFIADTEIRLVSAQDGSQLVAWPFTCLRRYMSSRGKFCLEAGRRAPTGEGKFTFTTSQHDEIYKLLDNVIKSRAGHAGQVTAASSRPSELPLHKAASNDDSYDHLMSSPLAGVTPVHAPHPNYNQNVMPSLSQKSDKLKTNDYASPYAHMRNRESVTSMRATKDVDVVHNDVKSEGYDTLSHQAVDTPTSNKGIDGYDMLNPSMPSRLPPPAPATTHSQTPCDNPDGKTEGFYNTINTTQSESEKQADKGGEDDYYNNLNHGPGSPPDGDNTYDSLDHQQGSVTKQGGLSFTTAFERMRQTSFNVDDDTYNVLSHVGSPVSSPVPKGVDAGGDDYSTLDRTNTSPHTPLRQTKSYPVPPPRVPSTASERFSQGYDRSSISSVSSGGSFDVIGSFRESQLSMSPAPDEQDFYSSIDYGTVTPTRTAPAPPTKQGGTDVPAKQVIPKPSRRTKPQDIDEDNQQRNRKSLVSNLRASLIADGLNLRKISPGKHGVRRHSVDAIEESDTYDQINEAVQKEGGTHNKKAVRNKLVRSPSAPVEPEDIYEDPDISSQSKQKVLAPKPVKPRKKK
ncbi:hypothetical protein QZH41_015187, partial [Actinostola sp. cb2023]